MLLFKGVNTDEILDDFSSKNNASVAEDAFFHPDEIQQKLYQIIDGFTEKQKRVFQMKYFDDLSFLGE